MHTAFSWALHFFALNLDNCKHLFTGSFLALVRIFDADITIIVDIALYVNVLRCNEKGGKLIWRVFTDRVCFQSEHIGLTIMGCVGALCQVFIGWIYSIGFWNNSLQSDFMFSKYSLN